jgi:signal transduction histidine kinase
MDMAINSLPYKETEGVFSLKQLACVLGSNEYTPLLVLRVPSLERLAWRQGRAAARRLERLCLREFTRMGRLTLRAMDALAHDDESDVFVAALVAPPRDPGAVTSIDCRAALARLVVVMEQAAGVEIESGWMVTHAGDLNDPRLTSTVEVALERGARERERYAFFSSVGHELRTPLTSIRGYIETLLGEELDVPTVRRFLEIAHAEAMRLGSLIDGMFALSVLDLHESSVRGKRTCCDVAQALRAVVDATALMAKMRDISVTLCEPRDSVVPMRATIGPDRLIQTIANLIDNALKYGVRGGRVELRARVCAERYVEILVEDDGPGVPPAERDAIFVLGKRGVGASVAGTGIGLATARLIVDRAGGEITVGDSALGGALFCVRIPFALSEASP